MDLDRAVRDVIEQVHSGAARPSDSAALERVLANYSASEWPAIAVRAREVWKSEAKSGRDIGRALSAALAASLVYRAAGNEEQSLRTGFDFLQTLFMVANDLDSYQSTREQLLKLFSRAKTLGILDVAFEAATAAADCAYFAIELSADKAKVPMLSALLEDIGIACAAARLCADCRTQRPASFEKFVSLLVAGYQTITEALANPSIADAWLATADKKAQFTAQMLLLAADSEALVPDDFHFVLHGEPEKSARAARILAEISTCCGDRTRAKSRLQRSIQDD
jgi:hypothetical protein